MKLSLILSKSKPDRVYMDFFIKHKYKVRLVTKEFPQCPSLSTMKYLA